MLDIHGTIANNSHWSGTRPVCVLQLVSTNDSKIERLCALLPACIYQSLHCG